MTTTAKSKSISPTNKRVNSSNNHTNRPHSSPDAEEMKNIMSDLKDQVVGENDNDSNNSGEDANNNVCDEKLHEHTNASSEVLTGLQESLCIALHILP